MSKRKFLIFMSLLLALVVPVVGTGMPMSPTDETKVPHYFGPYPNWANSPFRLPDAQVVITGDGTGATAEATVGANGSVTAINVTNGGSNYTAASVTINGGGTGATATAVINLGTVTAINVTNPGSGYMTQGIRKFVDTLPGLTPAGANNLGQYIPVAVPDQTTFSIANGFTMDADYYEIAVVQYQEQMHSDLPPTTLRGYVQLETPVVQGIHYSLPGGKLGVDKPHYLGPTIVVAKDKPVRITFYNLLPTGDAGDLFLPVDSTIMGSGMFNMNEPFDPTPTTGGTVMDMVRNPMCTDAQGMGDMCFTKNRATLHLHGGNSPWISDGTPHQWITPAGENTMWPEGVSVKNVPDMVGTQKPANVPDCSAPNDGCMTFYYTNQQSARLMFYHDHSWGITRLNVYAGEAAAYIITDPTEDALVNGGLIPGAADTIPLVIQDRTFVPDAAQLAWQDPTWDSARWGSKGNLWYHHVYMPAQNPGDPGGMSAFGRWMYGPWFWPPAGHAKYGPIDNPYYNMDPATGFTTPLAVPCNFDDPATWQYQEDPFCEPALIPGTPNISAGMEQFNDTPLVNGTAYPTITLEPKSYRFRILSAANDRFFNLQWYVGDPTTASTSLNSKGEVIGPTEVALNLAEVAAAQLDPVVFPKPDTSISLPGPDWIQIGTEGGFLPAPVVVDGQQVTTWITDPTRFDVGNVDQHSLLLAPAERADVIVDFSKFAGQTLILYNDAPAAFPARIPSYDYYTGAPDLRPVGAPTILPGYGPNTRTIMQVKVANNTPDPAFNLAALNAAFTHKADGSGVFESGQHPIIVGQAAYNSAYGTSFASGGWCNAPRNPSAKCDGFVRISEQGGDLFKFDTLSGTQVSVKLEPKAIHDETNASAFDEFGRMQANLGLEVVPATPGLQNVVLHPYVFPPTEIIDTTNLPRADVKVTPISVGTDGTQIWKITHNGVDTHPIHFHAYDVQLLNRVTWDNIIIPPDLTELGWKDTLRIAPLEDTIVALRPVIPTLPFEIPNSIRLLSPMMVDGAPIALSSVADALGLGMTAFAPNGDPIDVYNHYINFGAEYVYHCHILSHEEMDMMRPVLLAFPPNSPDRLAWSLSGSGNNTRLTLTWNDNSINETQFVVQRNNGLGWIDLQPPIFSPLNQPNTKGPRTYTDTTYDRNVVYAYRVVAQNTVGDTWNYANPNLNEIVSGGFPTVTAQSVSTPLAVGSPPLAPTSLVATLQAGPQVSLIWTDNATNETGFIIERALNGGVFTQIATAPARNNTGSVTYVDATVVAGNTFTYRIAAVNGAGSAYSNTSGVSVPSVPIAPSNFTAANGPNGGGNTRSVILTWFDNSTNETGFTIQRATNSTFTSGLNTVNVAANIKTLTQTGLSRNTNYYYRIRANNGNIIFSAWVNATPFPIRTNP